jgi:hypothetical protein
MNSYVKAPELLAEQFNELLETGNSQNFVR